MTAVLDRPVIDTTTLDETILAGAPCCESEKTCDNPAGWSCVMRCCRVATCLCSVCLARDQSVVQSGVYIRCGFCKAQLGFVSSYDEIVTVLEL